MGSQNSEIDNDQFRQANWQEGNKTPQFQVWRSRSPPFQSLQQYDIFTQNDSELNYQRKAFQLRRRSPLLVAAHYFHSFPKDNFCSLARKHSLYLERIPIRLEDVEHVPYPDYLHIFDVALKGFAQLARWVGYFPIDEGMVGINEQGIVKVWLNANLAATKPFGKATEAQMISSLIEAIDRNIDPDQLPPSIPTVRNFLYKNSDSLTFDQAIWDFGQFVHRFNSGQVPIRLQCIDEAGGVYAIANRPQDGSHLKKSTVKRNQVKGNPSFSINNPSGFTTIPGSSQRVYSQLPVIIQQSSQGNSQQQVISQRPVTPYVPFSFVQPIPIIQPNIQIIDPRNGSIVQQLQSLSSRKSIDSYAYRTANAPKFTVQVIPGKVIPQMKSSTTYLKSSKYIPSQNDEKGSNHQISLLQEIHPRFATSQKEVSDISPKIIPIVNNKNGPILIQPLAINGVPHVIAEDDSGPNSKRSVPQVVLDNRESTEEEGGLTKANPDPVLQYFNNRQFKDTESIPQDSAHNSLAVSFNPSYERELSANQNGPSPSNSTFYEKLAQLPTQVVNWHPQNSDQNDQVRVTGKFNLYGSQRIKPEYQTLENNYYDHTAFHQEQPQKNEETFNDRPLQSDQFQGNNGYYTEQHHIDLNPSYYNRYLQQQLSSNYQQPSFFPSNFQ